MRSGACQATQDDLVHSHASHLPRGSGMGAMHESGITVCSSTVVAFVSDIRTYHSESWTGLPASLPRMHYHHRPVEFSSERRSTHKTFLSGASGQFWTVELTSRFGAGNTGVSRENWTDMNRKPQHLLTFCFSKALIVPHRRIKRTGRGVNGDLVKISGARTWRGFLPGCRTSHRACAMQMSRREIS